jgi:hypothetical protein
MIVAQALGSFKSELAYLAPIHSERLQLRWQGEAHSEILIPAPALALAPAPAPGGFQHIERKLMWG